MDKCRYKDLKGREYFSRDMDKYYITAGTEDDMDVIDVYATAKTHPNRIYSIEIKCYDDPQYPRNYSKFTSNGKDYGFQIDVAKLDHLMNKYHEENRIPILYCRFNDYTIAWNISKINYKERIKQVWTNKYGMNYGKEKELTYQTYLYISEAVYVKETHGK